MSLPLVTRFGPTPILDEEIANKAYVDASGGGATPRFVMYGERTGTFASNTELFAPLGSLDDSSSTEGDVDVPITFVYEVNRMRAVIQTNTKNGNTVLAFRDDGVSIGALTISASGTGSFDSGALTDSIVAGSLVNWVMDMTASSSGSIGDMMELVECQPT